MCNFQVCNKYLPKFRRHLNRALDTKTCNHDFGLDYAAVVGQANKRDQFGASLVCDTSEALNITDGINSTM